MKTLILILSISFPLFAKSQNLLNTTSDFIKKIKSDQGAYFEGSKYASDGGTYLQFDYDTHTTEINDILTEAYYLNSTNKCDSYRIIYMSNKTLDYVVSQINKYGKFTKIPDKFMWVNSDENYRVEIKLNSKGFEMICANGLSN